MTPQLATLLLVFLAGAGVGWTWRAWCAEQERERVRQRLLDWQGAYSRWMVHRAIFGEVDSTGVFTTGVYEGKNSFEVMARLRRPAPGKPVSCLE